MLGGDSAGASCAAPTRAIVKPVRRGRLGTKRSGNAWTDVARPVAQQAHTGRIGPRAANRPGAPNQGAPVSPATAWSGAVAYTVLEVARREDCLIYCSAD